MAEEITASPIENSPEPTGQEVSADSTPEEGQVQDDYFSYDWGDGRVETFKTKEDLTKAYRGSHLRQDDYSRKTNDVARDRESVAADRKKYDTEYTAFLESKNQYDKYDKFLKENPTFQNRIKREMASNRMAGNPQYEELQNQMKDIQSKFEGQELAKKEETQQQEENNRKATAHSSLKARYPDYNQEAIEKRLEELNNALPGDEINTLLEMMHFAAKGRKTPGEIQEKVLETLQHKKNLKTPITGGTHKGLKKKYDSPEDAAKAAKRELFGIE